MYNNSSRIVYIFTLCIPIGSIDYKYKGLLGGYMDRLSLKGKIFVVFFLLFLSISAIMFDCEQLEFAFVSLSIALIFALLLVIYHKRNMK